MLGKRKEYKILYKMDPNMDPWETVISQWIPKKVIVDP